MSVDIVNLICAKTSISHCIFHAASSSFTTFTSKVLYSAPDKLYLRYLGDYDQLVRSIRLLP